MKTLISILVCLLIPSFACAAPLTLEQCIARGLTHNPEIRAYELAVDEGTQGVNEAWGAFLPTLSISYTTTWLKNGTSGERDTDYLDQTTDNLNCRLTQPLFSGLSGIAGLKRARQSKQYRQTELLSMQQQLVREIRTSFYSLIHAQQRAVQWRSSVQRLEKQQAIARAWVDQQLASKLRLLEVEVELSNARHALIKATSDAAIASAQLNEWLAIDSGSPLLLVSGSLCADDSSPCQALKDCLEQAQLQRPELRLTQLSVEMARQEAKMIRGRNLPQAQIDASWIDYQRDYDKSSITDDDRDYYSVSLNLSMKPFQGGRNLFAWRKQRIIVKRLEHLHISRRHAVLTEVETRYQQLNESRARVSNVDDALVEAQEAYHLALRSAELEIISLDELLVAELRLTRTEISLIDARYTLQQNRSLLDYAIGSQILSY